MSKAGLPLALWTCAVWLACVSAAQADEDAARLSNTLAVQSALQQGRQYLLEGNHEAAVRALEAQLARIDGNREYLATLRDAYRGHVLQLRQSGRQTEAEAYLRRLQILDPGSAAQLNTTKPRAPASPIPASLASASPPASPPAAAPYKARGTSKEDVAVAVPAVQADSGDVFAMSNHKGHAEARAVIDRAEAAFRAQNYREAAALFSQADQLLPGVTRDATDRWAYCRVHGIVDRLNQTGITATELAKLDQELKQAARSSPKLEGFCKTVQGTIDERRAALNAPARERDRAIVVKHGERGKNGWAVAETANFRVFHNESVEYAEKVARVAEQTRSAMQRKWFGAISEDWAPKCDVYLHATGNAYSNATQAPPSSPGHSTVQNEGSRILLRRIDLHVDRDDLMSAVLPHEATHIVLAGRFGPFQVPRWVDEGVAVLSEPADKIERHTRNLPRHRQDQLLFAMHQLVGLNDYPEPRFVGAFYAQSVSVVQFLASQPGGPQKFIQFVQDGLKGNYEASLKKHYGWDSLGDLEMRWRAQAFREGGGIDLAQQGR